METLMITFFDGCSHQIITDKWTLTNKQIYSTESVYD